ncbi:MULTISPECIES: tetratricopeptide repeat protein [unclassified Acidovorax]|uniref:tetratricopeptide repeat protein n=1 Tax=unclassified Acidovorax TaxID=2684926 RepID=UPI000B191ED9|nr:MULTISPECIES: tetratricopeptide repeat protein [unclassified Acidovorax]
MRKLIFGWFKKNEKELETPPASPTPDATEATELPNAADQQIKDLCARGDHHAAKREFNRALSLYWEAFDLLPEPRTKWNAGTWILTVIGDANFLAGDFVAGRDNLTTAMHYPDAIGNPFIHLRLGQCQFELGERDRAADELTRAYMGGGMNILLEDDPKYLEFLESRIKL